MQVKVLGFAGVREILQASERSLELPGDARVRDAWKALEERFPALASHRSSTRVAQNGRLVEFDAALHDGDEIAILPPVGGG